MTKHLAERFKTTLQASRTSQFRGDPPAPSLGLAPYIIETEFGQGIAFVPAELCLEQAEMTGEWIAATELVEVPI